MKLDEEKSVMEPWPVAVFAHNEERHIIKCLESISLASVSHPIQAYVLVNGCRDRTLECVRAFAQAHSWVTLIDIKMGDKANAWNVFMHQVNAKGEALFFVDGDVTVLPGAFDALHAALISHGDANAAAAVPACGRNRSEQCRYVTELRLILGNLYAIKGEFASRIRSKQVKIPVGYIGDDVFVNDIAKWNLDPQGPFINDRVIPCLDAKFSFKSLSILSPFDAMFYFKRRIRYSIRHFQHELLVPELRKGGIAGIPGSVNSLYIRKNIELLKLRGGSDTLFDLIALRKIRSTSS